MKETKAQQKAVVVKAEVGAPKVRSLVTQVAITKATGGGFNENGDDAVVVTLIRNDKGGGGYSLIHINERSGGKMKDGPITLSINEIRAMKESSEALVNGMFIES
jgi:hypothetical protein